MNAPLAMNETLQLSAHGLAGGMLIHVHDDVNLVETKWRALQQHGFASVYQSFDWCAAWLSRVGTKRGISPCIVTGENALGQVLFILPLQVRTRRGFTIIEALSSPQCAYAGLVLNRDFARKNAVHWFGQFFEHVIDALPRHDVFQLENVAELIHGLANPLLQCRSFKAANQSHIMALQPDYKALLHAKRSAESRRTLRKRDQKLEAVGNLEFGLPTEQSARETTLAVMFEHQQQRLQEFGVFNVYDHMEQTFIRDMASINTPEGPLLRPYCLRLDGEILAVMLGAYFNNTYWALVSSLAPGDMRKLSPGDFALRAMIADLCRDGTSHLDFSAGDTAYKFHWSDSQVQLNLIIRCNSLKGLPLALVLLAREKLKRFAKRTPFLNAVLFSLRRHLKGRRP
jgi:CelD/BcsL family acetyltransferase involved in cellulose biosynthesis